VVRIAGWLSANWTQNTASPAITLALLSTLAPLPAAAQTAKVAKVASAPVAVNIASNAEQTSPDSRDFRFAARLAAVSRLNAPLSRAARRPMLAAPARRAVPIFKAPEVKVVKETRLPTAFAVRTLTKKVRPCADVIDLAVAKSRVRSGGAMRAA